MVILLLVLLWLGVGCAIAGMLHELEAAYRPRRQAPERPLRTGTRDYDGGLWL